MLSERAHLKECVRDDGEDREDEDEGNEYEECVHCLPFVERPTVTNGGDSVIGAFADLGCQELLILQPRVDVAR